MIKEIFIEISENFLKLSNNNSSEVEQAIKIIINSIKNKNKIMFCGNGGSAADSQHLAAELVGRYRIDRDPLSAVSLTTDTSTITAIANDYSFYDIFSRQVESIGKKGDVLYAISTSGKSKNVINAINQAKKQGIFVIGLTGNDGNLMNNLCDVLIKVPANKPDRIQEMHIAVGQIICGEVEKFFFEK